MARRHFTDHPTGLGESNFCRPEQPARPQHDSAFSDPSNRDDCIASQAVWWYFPGNKGYEAWQCSWHRHR